MDVREHMSAPVIAISGDADFKEAMRLMQKHRIRRLPVVDAAGRLAGIVAERDLVVAADRYLSSPVDVARIMTRRVVTIGDTAPVVAAASLLIEHRIGGLPVVNAARELLGIITETDLLKALTALLKRGYPSGGPAARRGGGGPVSATTTRGTKAKKRPVARTSKNPKSKGKRRPVGKKAAPRAGKR